MRYLVAFLILLLSCRPSHKIGDLVGVPKERPLEKTYWVLTELDGKPISTINEAKKLHVQFDPITKTASGFAGCNQFTGDYALEGKKLSLKNLASTRMFCQETMETETRYLHALTEIDSYKVEEHVLFLNKGDQQLAKFQADVKPTN
ncbi:MAG TPA: META domain-containing protein [Cyclobacteriaceae bacterium]|nr:META domain-containing protein [Cyclobacteriaceae bacterium]